MCPQQLLLLLSFSQLLLTMSLSLRLKGMGARRLVRNALELGRLPGAIPSSISP